MAERKNFAIYDAGVFATFWKRAHGDDGTHPPVIDFSKEYVIGVFAGTEPTGGYHIAVQKVTESGGARAVTVAIEKPGDNCSVVEEQTAPYQFVTVPFSPALALSHTDETVSKNCK
jgi:hypothetical protein